MSETIQNRLRAALELRGWMRDTLHSSHKYVTMRRTVERVATFPVGPARDTAKSERLFLGRSGALRYSAVGRSTQSIPVDKTKGCLLEGRPSWRADDWPTNKMRRQARDARDVINLLGTV